MRKVLRITGLVVAVLSIAGLIMAVWSVCAFADTQVSAKYGHIEPKNSNLTSGEYVGASVLVDLTDNVAAGVEALGARFAIKSDGYKYGVLQVMPVMGVTKVKADVTDKLSVFVEGASGIVFSSVNENNEISDYGIKVEVKPAICTRVGVGADYKVSNDILINASVSRFTSEVKATVDGASEDVDLSSWLFGGAVTLRF